ncbi:A-kinase anchor protein 6 [Syngnathus scovelli]|uniref:A-kinase anchor protein 6 n=1 Tax=Syngnathus scovelli TaxID=161590 RepID=UPI00210F7AB0|nr:A-kinase anchor protein 6 [Syngnathus scovelli]XP_049596105.1 A-kinase anchor protein 6 [Syngnathus scovelli]XP_049596106.1 A-kinase anchor protein 6 [Syngnathus scovelli]
MSAVALSSLSPEPPSPMLTAAAPTPDQGGLWLVSPAAADVAHRRPPPVQACADWQVLLHLPQTEAWLRTSGARVTRLTRSVALDGDNRHVDAHLLQLKDICEDISDHVEQIHALLETELSLKLLSYSINIIVDIRTVQLLWHQLRVSVLVLKERLLRGLQDPNGNFTRKTDILQAFSQDQDQHQGRRLDALTDVDDCGRLTIRCSQDYFSLDCGITAYELSDYSPGNEPESREKQKPDATPEPEEVATADVQKKQESQRPKHHDPGAHPSEAAKSKRAVLILDDSGLSELQIQAQLHPLKYLLMDPLVDPQVDPLVDPLGHPRIDPRVDPQMDSRVDPLAVPERSELWLELDSVCPEKTSEDVQHLKVVDFGSIRRAGAMANKRFLEVSPLPQRNSVDPHGDSDCSALSPVGDWVLSSESEPRAKEEMGASSEASPDKEHWYGSDEFLALPAQIHKSELLALNLESLSQALGPSGEELGPGALQNVDDWDLTELNQDAWDSTESGEDVPSSSLGPVGHDPLGRLSPASSGDSLDESIQSGQLSEPRSEEGREPAPDRRGSATLTWRLLEDTGQYKDPDVWNKMEEFVRRLDGFIGWLQGALESTGDWAPPAARLDALKSYLDTHLMFKVNVDSHSTLQERIMDDGRALLAIIPAQQSELRGILRMVSGQWDQLQLQIRRQHAWMLRALRQVSARLLQHAGPLQRDDDLRAELVCSHYDAQPDSLRQLAAKLAGLCYASPAGGGCHVDSQQDFERTYEELLTDADAAASDIPWPPMSKQHLPRKMHSPPPSLCSDVPEHLRASIEELKAWLRHAELLIFNSCLRRPRHHARQQLASFKSLCWDVRARRCGVSRLLKLCQKLLRQNQPGPEAEAEAERRRQALQLLSINLERRWEAVLMHTLHWHNRLKRELPGEPRTPGELTEPHTVPRTSVETGPSNPLRVSPHRASPHQSPLHRAPPPAASAPDDSWEWDETDLAVAESHKLTHKEAGVTTNVPPQTVVYQVYGLHTVEWERLPEATERKQHTFHRSPSKDSTFSSMESLLGRLTTGETDLLDEQGGERRPEREGANDDRLSGSESGIVSDAGDIETVPCRRLLEKESVNAPTAAMLHREEQRAQRAAQEEAELNKGDSEELDSLEPSATRFPILDQVARPHQPSASPLWSPGSSLESLLLPGRELFPSKEHLHRSASLESGLFGLGRSLDGHTRLDADTDLGADTGLHTDFGLQADTGPDNHTSLDADTDLDPRWTGDEDRHRPEDARLGIRGRGQLSSGELSRRTLDLLKRLENIQSPPATKMTRSVSELTLGSQTLGSQTLGSQTLTSPWPGDRRSRGSREVLPSLVDDNSASLTVLPKRRSLLLEGASKQNSYGRSGHREEVDAVSLSMVVNVSCSDDENDGDLLSSSTLTEEEMEVLEEEEEEERLMLASFEDDDRDDELAAEEAYVLGLDDMKNELQACRRSPPASKKEVGLWDELQCGSNPEQGHPLNSTKGDHQEEANRRRFMSQFADDVENGNVENGNVENGGLEGKDADDELLREESAVFTKRGEPLNMRAESHALRGVALQLVRDSFTFSAAEEDLELLPSSPTCEYLPPAGASSFEGQLMGELPCQSVSFSPDRKAITIQEKFKFSSLVTEESSSKLQDKHSCHPSKNSHTRLCCWPSLLSLPSSPSPPSSEEAVHNFVMEILDLTSEARQSKEIPGRELTQTIGKSDAELSPASFQHIREKVAQHSHRPLRLRKGDFYAYLSLSSHDSDCGELTRCAEDGVATVPAPYLVPTGAASPTPSPPPSLGEETLVPACTEEAYLGPPLCYSLPPTDKARAFLEREARLPCPQEIQTVTSAPPLGCKRQIPKHSPEESQSGVLAQPEPSHCSLSKIQRGSPPGKSHPHGGFPEEADVGDAEEAVSGEARPQGARCLAGRRVLEAPRTEAHPYLNPRARVAPIDSSAAHCLADTKRLQSNIGAVMTEISDSGSTTNPSKEPPTPTASAQINPKINRRPIKEADRAAGRRGEVYTRGGSERPQDRPAGARRRLDVKKSAPLAGNKNQASAVNQATRVRSQVLDRPIRTGPPSIRVRP